MLAVLAFHLFACGSPDGPNLRENGSDNSPGPEGCDWVNEVVTFRDKELATATRVDYLAYQASIVRALAQIDEDISRFETISSGDVTVTSVEQFLRALSESSAGQTVFVPDHVTLDLTGQERIVIPEGVTVASSRRIEGSPGALIYTNDLGATLFEAGIGARIVGVNLMGPDPERRTYQSERLRQEGGTPLYYSVPAATGILITSNDVRIESCELWGWARAAIELGQGATGVVIRHNLLHHNQRRGLGYGVYLDEAEAIIEANLFDWSRHCVAGSGRPGTGYEARYNFVLPNMNGHAFDMHGGSDRDDGTDIAGSWMRIHHNIVEGELFPAIEIRGRPIDGAWIYENIFRNPSPEATIVLKLGAERIQVERNQFGVSMMRVE